MSYDLAVLQVDDPITDREAGEICRRLAQGWRDEQGWSSAVEAFYSELTSRWPELDTVPEDKIDDTEFCPWSVALGHYHRAVVMNCVYSRAAEVHRYVAELALKHGLAFFDPQSGKVSCPKV
jgi:hypothetical protein